MEPKIFSRKNPINLLLEFTRMQCGKNSNIRLTVLVCLALAAVTLSVYIKAGEHQFLNLDDNVYVTNNPHVLSGITGTNILWAFTSFDEANWHPITWLSHMADAGIFGMNPRGHHLTNVVIHTVSSILLLIYLLRITGLLWESLFVAALFALHPLHVESVAWVAERKDVLSALFCFLTLIFYSEYVMKRKYALYMLSLFFLVLGLMSKPMLVTLPILMLLIDFWPLNRYLDEVQGFRQLPGRVKALVIEKIPFLVFSLVSAILTIYAQNKGAAVKNLVDVPFGLRIENALISYSKYIGKTVWPRNLAFYYPLPFSIPLWEVAGSLALLLIVSGAAFHYRHRFPYLPVGWFWFLITLLPVIGFIQVGEQAMADRYTYIPLVGLFIMAAWGSNDLIKGLQHRAVILTLLAGTVISASAVLTLHQLSFWQNNISLYEHTLKVTTDNYVVHNSLAGALDSEGEHDAAIQEYLEAIRINHNFTDAHNNLGLAYARKGNLDAAINEYLQALRLDNYAITHYNLGLALFQKGSIDAAIHEYREALQINPDFVQAHNFLGIALARKGDLDSGIREFMDALRISPDDTKANTNLERAIAQKRIQEEAGN